METRDGRKIGAVVDIDFNDEKITTPSEQTIVVALNTC